MAPSTSSPSRVLSPGTQRSMDTNAATSTDNKLNTKPEDDFPVMSIPKSLAESDESESEDESPSQAPPLFMNMNQSIFGLIAAAGEKVDFTDRFDENSSSDEESLGDRAKENRSYALAQTTILLSAKEDTHEKGRHRRKLSSHRHKLLKSLPTLPKLQSKSRRTSGKLPMAAEESDEPGPETSESSSIFNPPEIKLTRENTNRLAPVMSRMLEARAEVSSRPSFDLDRTDTGHGKFGSDVTPLALRLMEIFEFDEPEHVVEEYPCWLLQSVLLQGYIYITAKHICFYAYLPKKSNIVAKSGFMSKTGKRNPSYSRYWFRLKGHVLSYYEDSTNLYFPHGQINLTYAISASVTDADKEGVHFNVVTRNRTYNLKADSAPSAKEWVKSLQRVIFRNHNDGDSVKISLPIGNIIDVEDCQMMDFADTCKIRVIDNDETYAIDEYFFSFFSFGNEAVTMLKGVVDEKPSSIRKLGQSLVNSRDNIAGPSSGQSPGHTFPGPSRDGLNFDKNRSQKPADHVKATLPTMSPLLSPLSPSPGGSADVSRRSSLECFRPKTRKSMDLSGAFRDQSPKRSFSASRRSGSRQRQEGNRTPRQLASPESHIQSPFGDQSYSNLGSSSFEDASASQILKDSDVFHQSPVHVQSCPSQLTGLKGKGRARDKLSVLSTPMQHAATTGHMGESSQHTAPTPTLQSITKMGAYPLQRAAGFADYLNRTRQRMGDLLATESMGYVEKVSGMWKGGRKHYDEPDGLRTDDSDLDEDSDEVKRTSNERFRAHFALPESEKLQATYFGSIVRMLPLYGKLYLSNRSLCFRSLLPGTRTKLILPLQDIENVHQEKSFNFGYPGLVIVIRGHEELFFEFSTPDHRDDLAITILRSLEAIHYLDEAGMLNRDEEEVEGIAVAERDALQVARQEEFPGHELTMPRRNTGLGNAPPILDESDGSFLDFRPKQSLKITCLTIGSRGDVQPYIALCKGLLAHGHKPRIATHGEFQGWIESHGIEFARVEGDPAELMRLCIENGTFTWNFLREANSTFRGWVDELLVSAATACAGSDVLIESPSAMAGIHIAEQQGIPYFRAFTMPWTRTRAYPHAFITPEHKKGGAYNWMTYVMFDNIFWKAISNQVNRWRNNTLELPNTTLEKQKINKIPFLYNFSPAVVAPPLDFSDWIRVTGYWFLDEGDEYEPPADLVAFINKARADNKKIVYVGFGSIIVKDPAKMTEEVIGAVTKAGVRCILSKGWSDRISSKAGPAPHGPTTPEPEIPSSIYVINSAPHDWLFSRIDAAAHHGGSGTTGASLRAGIPTIIRPFFGDQFFFASRVEDLGVGVFVKKWGTNTFGRALWEATNNHRIINKARVLGEHIRKENGVDTAIQSIYRDLEYAKSLIKLKAGKHTAVDDEEDKEEVEEESWTLVGGDEHDPDNLTRKLSEAFAGLGARNE